MLILKWKNGKLSRTLGYLQNEMDSRKKIHEDSDELENILKGHTSTKIIAWCVYVSNLIELKSTMLFNNLHDNRKQEK